MNLNKLFAFFIVTLIITLFVSSFPLKAVAASRSSHNIAYVNFDDSGFTESGIPSGNIFSTSVIGGPAPTALSFQSVTYNGMTFTPIPRASLSSVTLSSYDTLILFENCDIGTFSSTEHTAINAFLAAGNKIIIYDADKCFGSNSADYSWFTYPFTTSNPGPDGALGKLDIVENSTLTQGLASDPFNNDELGDANTAKTSDPHWFAAAKTTNILGNNGYFLAYARNSGLVIYDGADHWFSDQQTKSLTDLFLNELNQQFDPDNLPSTIPISGGGNIAYVALGDSYSSGEGAPDPDYLKGTDQSDNKCHRSIAAYPELLDKNYSNSISTFTFKACSGATIQDFSNPNHEKNANEPAQLNWLNTNTKLVTLTIGGNNLFFADVMQYCATRSVNDTSCKTRFEPIVNAALSAISITNPNYINTLLYLFKSIEKHAPNAKIVVIGYPRLFPSNPPLLCATGAPQIGSIANPNPLPAFFTRSDMLWLNDVDTRLNNALNNAVNAAGGNIEYINIYDVLSGHELCTDDPYLNRTIIDTSIDPIKLRNWSFHPKIAGQQAIATYIENHIGSL